MFLLPNLRYIPAVLAVYVGCGTAMNVSELIHPEKPSPLAPLSDPRVALIPFVIAHLLGIAFLIYLLRKPRGTRVLGSTAREWAQLLSIPYVFGVGIAVAILFYSSK